MHGERRAELSVADVGDEEQHDECAAGNPEKDERTLPRPDQLEHRRGRRVAFRARDEAVLLVAGQLEEIEALQSSLLSVTSLSLGAPTLPMVRRAPNALATIVQTSRIVGACLPYTAPPTKLAFRLLAL